MLRLDTLGERKRAKIQTTIEYNISVHNHISDYLSNFKNSTRMKKCNLVSCGIMSYIFSIHYLSIIYKEFSIIFLKVQFSKTKKVVHICIGLARVTHSKWAYKSSKSFNNWSKNVIIQINICTTL